MVDVSDKNVSIRVAVAAGEVHTTIHVLNLLRSDGLPKGDALGVARLAGIMAAKRTPELVPLCHPIAIHGVTVELVPRESSVEITATVKTADRTGVEMEALTCVAVAGLALIDMIKAVDPAATINDVRVLSKEGGKTGLWTRSAEAHRTTSEDVEQPLLSARVIVASTRAATGVYIDRSGPILVDGLRALGCEVAAPIVVADGEPVRAALLAALAERVDVIVTSGGTGISPTDHTPEVTRELLDREIPGIAEALRGSGPATAALSRGLAGVSGDTFVVNLPGSTGGARDGLVLLGKVLRHVVDQIRGGDHK
jgi:cyclic pyranopterin phosphate synthase